MNYKDICAYEDEQVQQIFSLLLQNKPFMELLSGFKSLPDILNVNDFSGVKDVLAKIDSVDSFQKIMYLILNRNIHETTSGLSCSGLENLPPNASTLFISNHRSTSLDASYLNYVLHSIHRPTAYSGAGDNIFETNWLGHLIRLNKGFIIKRDVQDVDEKLIEAEKLSRYIYELLIAGRSVWISQQPGRAKNGMDKTDSVVITMLNKFNPETKNYSQWLEDITLIPLCISWEIIPCGLLMAKDYDASVEREPFVDMKNILHEINSPKGNVHYHFGKRIHGKNRSEIVRSIDEQITGNYRLWGTNWLAYLKTAEVSKADEKFILEHIDFKRAENIFSEVKDYSPAVQKFYYKMYANSVISALEQFGSVAALIDFNLANEKISQRIR